MVALKVTIELPPSSSILKDAMVNDFYFLTAAAVTTTDTDDIALFLQGFYNTVNAPGTVAISQLLGHQVSRTIEPTLRYYDVTAHLNGSPAGSPFLTRPLGAVITANPANPIGLPAEVALCLTYKSAYGTDGEFGPIDPATGKKSRPRARDRGRLYIGPLNVDAMSTSGSLGDMRPSAAATNALVGAGAVLMGEVTPSWAVWSRRGATMEPVTGGWSDNAFDTQRRRGSAPTGRTIFGSLT